MNSFTCFLFSLSRDLWALMVVDGAKNGNSKTPGNPEIHRSKDMLNVEESLYWHRQRIQTHD